MSSASNDHSTRGRAQRRRTIGVFAGLAAILFAISLVAVAVAASTSVKVSAANNTTLNDQVVVNAQGRTLYELSPETSTHLLCKSSECLKAWPPVTVPSRSSKLIEGSGVHGHLAILRRSNGTLQLTLNGHPLYRFSGDSGKDESNGQGIKSFGGTWHAAVASTTMSSSGSTGSGSTTPTTPSKAPETPYGY
jgi:predicted lipoprotein with Yx(FWY)xxD motif